MRKDVAAKKEYIRTEQALKNLRYAAYMGADDDGNEKVCILRIAGDEIDMIDIFRPGDLRPGDVFMGRIENCNENIAVSFADIGKKDPVFIQGKIKPGTELPLCIKTLPYREKLAKATVKIETDIAEAVSAKAAHALKGALLYRAEGAFEKSIAESCSTEGAKWVTENEKLYELALAEAADKNRIVLHKDENLSLCALYGLKTKLAHVLSPRVDLRSGAQIVISETEAMCVIDVNSAKSLTGKNKDETFLKLNLEASEEIVRQLSARNISGIIMVDFINMKSKESETILLENFDRRLKTLKPPARLEDITKLGIAEISRKRLRGSIASEKAFLDRTILTK